MLWYSLADRFQACFSAASGLSPKRRCLLFQHLCEQKGAMLMRIFVNICCLTLARSMASIMYPNCLCFIPRPKCWVLFDRIKARLVHLWGISAVNLVGLALRRVWVCRRLIDFPIWHSILQPRPYHSSDVISMLIFYSLVDFMIGHKIRQPISNYDFIRTLPIWFGVRRILARNPSSKTSRLNDRGSNVWCQSGIDLSFMGFL